MIFSNFFGEEISLLGFGLMRLPRIGNSFSGIDYEESAKLIDYAMSNGVNYYDTAYTYGGSEEFVGAALSKFPRDKYYLATKCPPWKISCSDDFDRIFDEQCKRCNTDYFDFYLVHNLAQEATRAAGNEDQFRKFVELGLYDMYKRKKDEGRIRRLGFSFHGTLEIMERLVDSFDWDFALVQINYVDWAGTDAKSKYESLSARGIPISIMEPLRGGALANLSSEAASLLKNARPDDSIASWGIRYAASLPNIITVLSGMNSMAQLKDNIETMDNFRPLDSQETELLYEAAALYSKSGAIPCTGCGYCLPCPQGVNIPRIFAVYNHYLLMKFRIPFDNGYSTLYENEKASNCVNCGQCSNVCPQHIRIPGHMSEINAFANARE